MLKLILLSLVIVQLHRSVFTDIQTRSFYCTSTNKSIERSFKCFAKSWSRKHSTLNMDFNITRPITRAKLHLDVQYRSITPFFNSLVNVTINLCGFLNGTENNNAMKWIFDMISKTTPKGLLHSCPYLGHLEVYNCTLEVVPVMSVFLTGRYRTRARIYDDYDENVFSTNLEMDLTV